jgi:glycine/D-amino acid oxidase-like deaminating enzyme
MEPHDSGVDWDTVELGADKALTWLTGLDGAQVVNAWSGLRTLTPDSLFVLGPDPRLEGLYWAAGLCGHGMTTSWAVGRLTAELVLEGNARTADVAPFRPDRFLG